MTADDLRYPIGPFSYRKAATPEERRQRIAQIERAPAELRAAVRGLTDEQLDTPYRPGGWTVRQVVHHVPDSHLNAVIRFKLALTEANPTIKPLRRSTLGRACRCGRHAGRGVAPAARCAA